MIRLLKKWFHPVKNLDVQTSEFLLPKLKKLRSNVFYVGTAHPSVPTRHTWIDWYLKLGDIIYFHECVVNLRYDREPPVDRNRFNRGQRYFYRHYLNLWE